MKTSLCTGDNKNTALDGFLMCHFCLSTLTFSLSCHEGNEYVEMTTTQLASLLLIVRADFPTQWGQREWGPLLSTPLSEHLHSLSHYTSLSQGPFKDIILYKTHSCWVTIMPPDCGSPSAWEVTETALIGGRGANLGWHLLIPSGQSTLWEQILSTGTATFDPQWWNNYPAYITGVCYDLFGGPPTSVAPLSLTEFWRESWAFKPN